MDELDEVVTAAPKRPNFTPEFRQSIIEMMLKPGACVAQIAREHGLNDNMLFKWRRRYLEAQARGTASVPTLTGTVQGTDSTSMLPVNIIDMPVSASQPAASAAAVCEVEVEVGKRRVRIRGVSQEFAERFLKDCLK
ncbi:transposase [Paraburkholderia sabiae]|uniref:Transposase n=1 Tax=Paraburkholderia sabiae TaxID=273251 RepID=A0ABU9QME3_9BURK|nr:transposase [Paraburkholderia sabiae]WJZ79114.1 transposase [Paraburkholderia sabiae]CAD6514310.1 hypothetical protein LMG24235_00887 [Paraburkholderia sabiae]